MWRILFWLYFINAVLLINHEIDSAYWQEWNLFKLPGGISGFLIIHFPLLVFILYGLVLVFEQSFVGLILSLLLALGGIGAFIIHLFFIKMGRKEFKLPVSLCILVAMFMVSIIQGLITGYLLSGR